MRFVAYGFSEGRATETADQLLASARPTSDALGTELHRGQLSRAIVHDINVWVDGQRGTALPRSPFGVSLEVAYNQCTVLGQFQGAPGIPLDNTTSQADRLREKHVDMLLNFSPLANANQKATQQSATTHLNPKELLQPARHTSTQIDGAPSGRSIWDACVPADGYAGINLRAEARRRERIPWRRSPPPCCRSFGS